MTSQKADGGPRKAAVILAAGQGTRLSSVGGSQQLEAYAKPLIVVEGMTLLERTVRTCVKAGVTDIFVVVGFRSEVVGEEVHRISALLASDAPNVAIQAVLNERWQLANGMSLLACSGRLPQSFALMMSDHVFDPSILRDLLERGAPQGGVVLAVDYKLQTIFDMDDATKVRIDDKASGKIAAISKKLEDFNAVDCGVFICDAAILQDLQGVFDSKGDASLSEGMAMVGGRGQFVGFDIGNRWWQDVDTPEMHDEVRRVLQAKITEFGF